MKTLGKIALLITLVLLVASVATAQKVNTTWVEFCSARDYENDQNDTLPANPVNDPNGATSGIRVAAASMISWYTSCTDSIEVIRYLQYRPYGGTAWTTLYADSTTSLTATGTVDEDIIRNGGLLDKFTINTGISGYLRSVNVFSATKNGVAGTTKYTHGLHIRP